MFKALPTFEKRVDLTVKRLNASRARPTRSSRSCGPVAQAADPDAAGRRAARAVIPRFFLDLGPLITAAKPGLPAVRQFLDDARPALGQLDPFTRSLNPFLGTSPTTCPSWTGSSRTSRRRHRRSRLGQQPPDPLPPHGERDQPRGPGHLSAASGDQPAQPLPLAEAARPAEQRPAGVREPPVRERAAAGAGLPVRLREHRRRRTRRMPPSSCFSSPSATTPPTSPPRPARRRGRRPATGPTSRTSSRSRPARTRRA